MIYLKRLLGVILLCAVGFGIFQHEKSVSQFEKSYQSTQSALSYFQKHNKAYQKLPILEKMSMRKHMMTTIKRLQEDGWSDETIEGAYLRYLPQDKLSQKAVNQALAQTQIIGTQTFRRLWKTELARVESQQPLYKLEQAKHLLAIFLQQDKMPQTISGQNTQTKAMLARFDDSVSPADSLWSDLATLTQTAYPNDNFSKNDKLAIQLHQFRYIISSQQAQWIRRHYKTANDTDADALAKYLAELDNSDYTLNESARYHNKVASKLTKNGVLKPVYADNRKESNFKVLIHFHSEFILSESGDFLVATDVQKTTQNAIINSATFNYANQNDDRHVQLDVTPITYHEPHFVTKAMTANGETFVEPSLEEQKDKHNRIFSRKGKSSKQLSKAVAKAFKKRIKAYQQLLTPSNNNH
ncbi:DUF3114 domain-containing protein [Streptococcus hyointestinalis]|nr:DUF3114 domain-containing protein [Streptococcus hyointestinalis]